MMETRGAFWTQLNIYGGVFFAKLVDALVTLNIFTKHSILDVWVGFEDASGRIYFMQNILRIV